MASEYVKIKRAKVDALKAERDLMRADMEKLQRQLERLQAVVRFLTPLIEMKMPAEGSPEAVVEISLARTTIGFKLTSQDVSKEGVEKVCTMIGGMAAQKLLGPQLTTMLLKKTGGNLEKLVAESNHDGNYSHTNDGNERAPAPEDPDHRSVPAETPGG